MAVVWQDIKGMSNSEEVLIVDIGDNNNMENYESEDCIIFGKQFNFLFQWFFCISLVQADSFS